MTTALLRLGISRCLLGHEVRFDGGHKRDEFLTDIFGQQLIPEPAASTQSVYHALDPVVEAVLTDKNANVQSLLNQANDVAQAAISAGK